MSHHHDYQATLETLQIGLSRLQRRLIAQGAKVLVIFEGRDGAGKDGTIKRIAEHMSPRDTRIVALGVPDARDQRAWYFQRWCVHLPVAGEVALFNRSWYNRAGVERVMGFCSAEDYEDFLATVPLFEQLLVHAGFVLVKYWLDISRDEQAARLAERARDPLKQWKVSPIDEAALAHWDDYSAARDAMLARSHSVFAPWRVVRADDKHGARLAVIRDLLATLGEPDDPAWPQPDPTKVFLYDPAATAQHWLAP